jgi:hypothetical protein
VDWARKKIKMRNNLAILFLYLTTMLGYSILWETQEGRMFAAKWLVISGTFILAFKK